MEAGKASRSAGRSGPLRPAHVREDPPPCVFETSRRASFSMLRR